METDPNGKAQHELGAKLDQGKPCLFQGCLAYFPRAMADVAALSGVGANKYAWKGWESVPDGYNRYSNALVRHLAAEGKGEVLDTDTGLRHATAVAWNALARLELLLKEREEEIEYEVEYENASYYSPIDEPGISYYMGPQQGELFTIEIDGKTYKGVIP